MLKYAVATLLLTASPALAERAGMFHTINAVDGQAYAMRALCPARGAVKFEVLTLGLVPEAGDDSSNCTFGRIGFEFVAPYTAQFMARFTTSLPIRDTKFAIEPDCAGSPATTCGVDPSLNTPIVGRITFPGDEDWIRLANSASWNLKLTPTTTAGCFVTARVIEATANDYYARYVVITGGPSGCGYTTTVGFRGF
jgi:hypothetical protein